jgi:hypothetical protein
MAIQEFFCQVNQTGAAMNNSGETPNPMVLVRLTDVGGTFSNTWFYAPQAAKNQILAVALAAITTQSQVNVYVDPPQSGVTTQCYNMYIMAP